MHVSILLALLKPVLLLLLVSVFSITSAQNENIELCASQLEALENALYGTKDNLFELNSIFFPPSARTSRFIRVNYHFLDEAGESDEFDGGCLVTYIWAIGGFLFFQPPSLFRYNSLFFNYPNNNLTDLDLYLPYECQPLVLGPNTTDCSCLHDAKKLEILTQQLDVYAMYQRRDQVTREHTFARATCAEELEDIYYSGHPSFVFIIVCSTLLLPLFAAFLLCAAIRRVDDSVLNSLTDSSSHGTVVAVVLTGGIISIGILVCNILSCVVVVSGNHEYAPEIHGQRPINLYICFGTLALNILFMLPSVIYIFYISVCYNGRRVFQRICCKMVCVLHPRMRKLVILMIGKNTFLKLEKLSKDGVISLMFPLMIATPVLCASSHLGYIMLAWLTEPSKCTTAFLLNYMIFLYLYFAFKRFYGMHSKIKLSIDYLSSNDESDSDQPDSSQGNSANKNEGNSIELGALSAGENGDTPSTVPEENREKIYNVHKGHLSFGVGIRNHINTQTFCFLLLVSFAITGIAAMFVLIFLLLPFSSQELITYLFQLLQLVVVLVSTQISYQLLGGGSFSLQSIIEKFKEVYAKKGTNDKLVAIAEKKHEELSGVVGEFAAELTDVVISSKTATE